MRALILVCLAGWMAPAQTFSLGIKAGGVLTGALDPQASNFSETRRYTLGPMAALSFGRIGLEFDALYKRAGDRNDSGCFLTYCGFAQARAHVFEFPILATLRVRRGAFVSGGITWSRVGEASVTALSWRSGPAVPGEIVDFTVRRSTYTRPAETTAGGTAVAGLRFAANRLALSPELRYTRWSGRYWEQYGSRGYFTGSNLNQLELLFGLTF